MAGFSRSNLRIGHEPLCPGTTTTTGAWGRRGAITPLRLPASRRWTHFGEVDRVSLRQFYGWSANRRPKLCVSTFPCVQRQIVMSPLVAVQCVTKSYGRGTTAVKALDDVSLEAAMYPGNHAYAELARSDEAVCCGSAFCLAAASAEFRISGRKLGDPMLAGMAIDDDV